MEEKGKALREIEEVRGFLVPDLRRLIDPEKLPPLRHVIHNVGGHTDAVTAVAVTPDGTRLITGSEDHTARLWDLQTGRCLQTFTGHTSWVTAVAVTPDGTRLITGSGDSTARLWDLATGRCLQTFTGHTWLVTAVAVTPDGTRLITGSSDHTVKFWDLETGELLVTMYNVQEGYLWTTPPTEVAPSGWLWTNRKDLVSVIRCSKKDNSDPEALADDDPERENYLKVHNRQDMVMNRLRLPIEVIKQKEDVLKEILEKKGVLGSGRASGLLPQLGPGTKPQGGEAWGR